MSQWLARLSSLRGEGVVELAGFNRETLGMGHLTMFGLSRTRVVRIQDNLLSKVVGFYARKTAQGFWGCPGFHLTSQEGAQEVQVMSFLCLFYGLSV